MKETIWMHSLDHDIRLRKAITAFEDWAGFDHPDPGNFKWDTSAKLRDSLRLRWPDGEETEEWLTSLMQRVLDWQRSTDAGNRTEWLLDGRGMAETDLRDLFAQQVQDQPEAYWGEDEWIEADNEDIEREYEVWVEIHMRDGMLRSAADMEPDELERLIADRDEEDKPTEETLGLLDAWLGNPGGEDPADRARRLFDLIADHHGLPEGRAREEAYGEAGLINTWLDRSGRPYSPTGTYDEIAAYTARITAE